MQRFSARSFTVLCCSLTLTSLAWSATPVVTIDLPANGASVTSPVNYLASAKSPQCSGGITAMRIYSAPHVAAYTVGGSKINTYITLQAGNYDTVVQAWDACGNVGKANVAINVTAQAKPAGFVYTINSDYDSDRTTSNVRGFTIVAGGHGALSSTLQGPVGANVDPVAVTSDKGGFRLYVADYVSGDVFPYFIDRRNGYISAVPKAPFGANRSVAAVAVHPSGTLIFAALSEYNTGDGIAVFQLQSDGSLKEAPGSPYPTQPGPQALSIDPTGTYLYAAASSGFVPGAAIEAFQIDTVSASLTPVPGSPYKMPSTTCGIPYLRDLINLNGKFLYTADAVGSLINGFDIGSTTGTLSPISGSPWRDDGCQGVGLDDPLFDYNPKSLAIDGAGKFLYALNELDMDIAIYSIGSNGSLKFLKFTPQGSACFGAVRTDPTGDYLYAGACDIGMPANFGGLTGFSINHTTGDLTTLPTAPYTYPQPGRTIVQDIAATP